VSEGVIAAAVSEGAIAAALERVCDPCSLAAGAPLSVLDLGLVRAWALEEGGRLRVDMCVTGPGCTLFGHIADAVRRECAAVPGVAEVDVRFDFSVTWTPARMTAAGARRLHASHERSLRATALRPRQWQETTT
jgi:metal-sulfur cluster biosynthetic enzyme